jgi:hypothetical protein
MDNLRENLRHWSSMTPLEIGEHYRNHVEELIELAEFADECWDKIAANSGDTEIVERLDTIDLTIWSLLIHDWISTHGRETVEAWVNGLSSQ